VSAKNISQIAYEILAYLFKNPDARDTKVGIAGWWLLTQHIEREIQRQTPKVEKALEELVNQELIIAEDPSNYSSKGHQTYYRLNHHKRKEISQLLNRVRIRDEAARSK
jgi:hypothetical protein